MDIFITPLTVSAVFLLINLLVSRRVHRRHLLTYRILSILTALIVGLALGMLLLLLPFLRYGRMAPDMIAYATDSRKLISSICLPVLLLIMQILFNVLVLPRRVKTA